MNRKLTLVLLVLFLLAGSVFAQDFQHNGQIMPPYKHLTFIAGFEVNSEEQEIPQGIQNNEFYLESLRFAKLAQDTYDFGDYDASSGFAEEAIRYAALSDEYVADQLIAEAKRLIDWADSNKIAGKYPNDYAKGKEYYNAGLKAQSDEEWSDSIASSKRSIAIMAAVQAGKPLPLESSGKLPSQFTIRSWASSKDCFWNIAGYPGVYGDSWKWKELYEANKAKLPYPKNPNLIEPGIILDIPSIRGETREGMWEPNRKY